jgi:hypothetical protein
LVLPLHIGFIFLKNIKILIFGGISKFPKLIVFGQILSILSRFCYITSR